MQNDWTEVKVACHENPMRSEWHAQEPSERCSVCLRRPMHMKG